MAQRRKLLVFVSSTYTDLKEERQAAVEAILKAGHIPAGMELFAASDKSQMDIIKRWIDESDVYMLLLGGRYGSIEPESGKSYTQLEYEYAVEKGKAFFSVVVTEQYLNQKVAISGKEVLELHNPKEYKDFYKLATSRMVEFWSDLRDIKLAIHTTLTEFGTRPELVGWVPGNESIDSAAIVEEMTRLTRENAELRSQISQTPKDTTKYNGISFEDMYKLLSKNKADCTGVSDAYMTCFTKVAQIFGDDHISVIHVLWVWDTFVSEDYYESNDDFSLRIMKKVKSAALVEELDSTRSYGDRYVPTTTGRQFILRLAVERDTMAAEEAVSELKSIRSYHAENSFFLPTGTGQE